MKLEFLGADFRKIFECKNYEETISVAADLFCAGGQTDMSKRIIPFRNFAKAPKNKNTYLFPVISSSTWHEIVTNAMPVEENISVPLVFERARFIH